MTKVDFEARYQAQPDPWGYETSDYERDKYAATLRACGPGPFDSALELGASIGVFTALLASRCRRLDTIDLAATAVRVARERLAAARNVDIRCGTIPDDLPDGMFDLVVASETLYYLDEPRLAQTLAELDATMKPGARLVAVHWRPNGPERPISAFEVHRTLRAQSWLTPRRRECNAGYLLDVLERRYERPPLTKELLRGEAVDHGFGGAFVARYRRDGQRVVLTDDDDAYHAGRREIAAQAAAVR